MSHVTKFLMFYLEHHVYKQMCRPRDVFMCVFAHWKTRVCTLFWLTKSCLCITYNIWHHVCHQISNRRSWNHAQPHDLNYEHFSVSTIHIRNHVWEHWFDPHEGLWCVFAVKRRPSAQLFDVHGCVSMKIFSWEHVSVYNLLHNFLCLCSTDMFQRSVSTTRRFHTLKDGCCTLFELRTHF